MAGAVPPADEPPVAYPTGFGAEACHNPRTSRRLSSLSAGQNPMWPARLRGYHGERRALDCMISDSTAGWNIAKWVAIAKSLGVSEIIHRQHIWQRSSDGWRPMSDRCSPTANQMNHVHIVVYGDSGTV